MEDIRCIIILRPQEEEIAICCICLSCLGCWGCKLQALQLRWLHPQRNLQVVWPENLGRAMGMWRQKLRVGLTMLYREWKLWLKIVSTNSENKCWKPCLLRCRGVAPTAHPGILLVWIPWQSTHIHLSGCEESRETKLLAPWRPKEEWVPQTMLGIWIQVCSPRICPGCLLSAYRRLLGIQTPSRWRRQRWTELRTSSHRARKNLPGSTNWLPVPRSHLQPPQSHRWWPRNSPQFVPVCSALSVWMPKARVAKPDTPAREEIFWAWSEV